MDDIPDIDASLPEPDFFDAEDGNEFPLSAQLPVSQQLRPESIVERVQGAELKYDDELCEFNEFLIGYETKYDNSTKEGETVVKKSSVGGRSAEGKKDQDNLSHKKFRENEDEVHANKNHLLKDASTDVKNESISNSRPDTPDSKAGSAVIRLSLPTIPKVKSTNKKSPNTKNGTSTSPSLVLKEETRAGSISSNKQETRSKRKLSEDQDYEPDDEGKEEDKLDLDRFKTTTRSGRPTRKTARYGGDADDNVTKGTNNKSQKRSTNRNESDSADDSDNSHTMRRNTTRSGRTARKINRFGFENEDNESHMDNSTSDEDEFNSDNSEILFEPITNKCRTKYWVDHNGVTFFKDRNGTIYKLKPLSVALIRLSEDDINKIKDDLAEEVDDDKDNPFLLEVCVDNFMSVVEAVKGGAKRIELCSSLSEGGLTPTGGFLTAVKEKFPEIPVFVMIRPRGGDFVYSSDEIEIMSRDIAHYKQMGADGFVFGILTKDCEIDLENCRLLKQMAFPLECTFHRAFDKVSNPKSALETIISMGFHRILTSGQAATAHSGIPMLRYLVDAAGSRIRILAGAGLTHQNVGQIVRKTRVTEVHGSASKVVASNMCAPGPSKSPKRSVSKKSAVKMGSTDDTCIKVTDAQLVAQIVRNGRKNVRR